MEKTYLAFVFEAFPIIILRLLRLLRVFRVAKALPRLRSIVEALISGFSSVGWICVLILVYQYIVGCLCMLVFRENVCHNLRLLCFAILFVNRINIFILPTGPLSFRFACAVDVHYPAHSGVF